MPTEDQLASARTDWIERGLDAAAFDRALSGQLPPPAIASDPAATPAASPAAGPSPQWSEERAREMVSGLRARNVPDASLRAALAADGFTLDQISALLAAPAPDTRTDEEKALEQGGLEPGKASDFRPIEYVGRSPDGVDLQAFDADAKAFMQAVAAPALLGPSLVETALDAGKTYAALPEAHRELYHRTEESRVVDLLGPDKAREAYAKAAEMLKSPAIPLPFLEWLHGSGALRKADVIVALGNIAQIAGVRAAVRGGATIDSLLAPR